MWGENRPEKDTAMLAKCGHCNGTGTKIVEIQPQGAAFKQNAICCASCSSTLGVVGYFDAGALIKNQEAKITSLASQIAELSSELIAIRQTLQRVVQSMR